VTGRDPYAPPITGPYDHDEDLVAAARQARVPQVAVYRFPTTAVVIGYGGDPRVETRPEVIRADGIPLLRRRGGGCAVVLDRGNLVVSLATPAAGIGGITTAFAVISRWLAAGLAACSIPGVRQAGTSDLAVGDRKLGGSCLWRTRGLLYYSTTLLVSPDLERIDRYLPHPPREPEYRAGRSHRDFLTSLSAMGYRGTADDLAAALTGVLVASAASLPARLGV